MKYTKYIGMMIVAGGMLAATSCSDFSDYNSVVGDANPSADKTLWENISSNDKLQNFAKILKKAGFDANLSASQFYTVWAPLDGTYDADKILNLGDDEILKQFVKQHVAEYNHLISGDVDTDVLTLNLKNHKFTNTTFGESEISTPNIPARNGVMHTLSGMDPFYFSIYEFIESMDDSKFREFITRYDRQEIDEANSVQGPIVNNRPTYEHIEYRLVNDIIDDVLKAKLNNEDSIYTMLAPTDEAWDASYARINPDYKYLKGLVYADLATTTLTTAASSLAATANRKAETTIKVAEDLQDSITTYNIVKNLVFSHAYPQNDKLNADDATYTDTLRSTARYLLPSAKSIREHTVGEVKRMSNGHLREIDSLAFNSWDTFEPVIRTRNVARKVRSNVSTTSLSIRELIKERNPYAEPEDVMRDSIFANMPAFFYDDLLGFDKENFSYATVLASGNTASPEVDFALNNVLSTKYHMYVVMVPEQMDATTLSPKPYYLNFYMMYTDENNVCQKKLINLSADANTEWGPKSVTGKIGAKTVTSVVTLPGMVNVVDLGEFEFPYCYEGIDAYPSLLVAHTQSYAMPENRTMYEQNIRIARVYLIPAEYDKIIDKRLIKDIKK